MEMHHTCAARLVNRRLNIRRLRLQPSICTNTCAGCRLQSIDRSIDPKLPASLLLPESSRYFKARGECRYLGVVPQNGMGTAAIRDWVRVTMGHKPIKRFRAAQPAQPISPSFYPPRCVTRTPDLKGAINDAWYDEGRVYGDRNRQRESGTQQSSQQLRSVTTGGAGSPAFYPLFCIFTYNYNRVLTATQMTPMIHVRVSPNSSSLCCSGVFSASSFASWMPKHTTTKELDDNENTAVERAHQHGRRTHEIQLSSLFESESFSRCCFLGSKVCLASSADSHPATVCWSGIQTIDIRAVALSNNIRSQTMEVKSSLLIQACE